eukprot:2021189-Karenia_brevis.AAC.1
MTLLALIQIFAQNLDVYFWDESQWLRLDVQTTSLHGISKISKSLTFPSTSKGWSSMSKQPET